MAIRNPRIRHEFRILAPYVAAILVCQALITIGLFLLAAANSENHMPRERFLQALGYLCYAIGGAVFVISICALCLQSFLIEFQNSTIGQLVVQPVSRLQLWSEKLGVTAAALLLALSPAITWGVQSVVRTDIYPPATLSMGGILLFSWGAVMISAGPLIAMLMRRSLPALLLLIAYLIAVAFGFGWLRDFMDDFDRGGEDYLQFALTASLLLGLLAFVTFRTAYRRFERLEV
ncbi:MAG: hypothetical protein ACR2IE_02960 [Candidatus Sumerlaeaceae bacterium]